jgi:hypothetical protein
MHLVFKIVIAWIFAFGVGSFVYLANADEQRTNRIIENPVQDGNMVLRINDGGVKTDALTITGSTGRIAIPQGLTVGGNEAMTTYDEGTFTPTIGSSGTPFGSVTYVSQVGRFTRVGNQVCFTIFVRWNNTTGSPTGTLTVATGLPSIPATTSVFHVHTITIDTPTGIIDLTASLSGSTTLDIIANRDNNSDIGIDAATNTGAVPRSIYVSGCYNI